MRRSLLAFILVSTLSLVGLISCGAGVDASTETAVEEKQPSTTELTTFSDQTDSSSPSNEYAKVQLRLVKQRDQAIKSSIDYRRRRIEEQQERLEEKMGLMQGWLREDFKIVTNLKTTSDRGRLLELTLTEGERKRVDSLLARAQERHAKLLEALLQPALESFDSLFQVKLKQLSILEEEASLETAVFMARLRLFDALRNNWRVGREIPLYLLGFKWL